MEKKKKTGPDECCRAERQIGYEVRTLNQVIGRLVNSYQSKVDEKAGINRMQGWIIGYLYRHSEEAVFQKDLEAEFQMARSTASGILQAMEKKGLITREPIPRDASLSPSIASSKSINCQNILMANSSSVIKNLKNSWTGISPSANNRYIGVANNITKILAILKNLK